jgi:hypothetical protein
MNDTMKHYIAFGFHDLMNEIKAKVYAAKPTRTLTTCHSLPHILQAASIFCGTALAHKAGKYVP